MKNRNNIFIRRLKDIFLVLVSELDIPLPTKMSCKKNYVSDYLWAGNFYTRSYLSFDFALSFYGLIPETVYVCTSATERKNKRKIFSGKLGTFSYETIPILAFDYGVNLIHEHGMSFRIASREKALCDKLYIMKPLRTIKELIIFLDEDLRLDMDELCKFNLHMIKKLSNLYPSRNVKILSEFLEREKVCPKK